MDLGTKAVSRAYAAGRSAGTNPGQYARHTQHSQRVIGDHIGVGVQKCVTARRTLAVNGRGAARSGTSIGPPEWGLVNTAIKWGSFGWITAEQHREFRADCRHDATAWEGFELLRDIREFCMTTMTVQAASNKSAVEKQAQAPGGPHPRWAGERGRGRDGRPSIEREFGCRPRPPTGS